MIGVDWVLVAMIAAGVVVIVLIVAMLARAFSGAKKNPSSPAKSPANSAAQPPTTTSPQPNGSVSPARVIQAPATTAGAAQTTMSPSMGSEIVLTMNCDALKAGKGFTREIKLAGGNGVYTWTLGSKDSDRYEHWEMRLDGAGGFAVTGEYMEGSSALQPISFTGTVVGSAISGEGIRGPRKATIRS